MFTFAKGEEYEKRYNAKGAQLEAGLAYEQIKIKDYTIDRVLEMFEVIYASEPFAFPVGDRITEEDLSESTDTAVYVIARQAGEGSDRKVKSGDFLLDETEKYNLQFLTEHYDKVIVVINCGGLIDLSMLKEMPEIGALFFYGQGEPRAETHLLICSVERFLRVEN